MKRIIAMAALTAILAGCATANRDYNPTRRPVFPEAEYAALAKTGSATVTGQLFMRTRGGDVKTGAGDTIYLNPVTSYSAFAYEHRSDPDGMTDADPRLFPYMRNTVADATGRFTFKNVPDGEYYLSGKVTWEVPNMATQGGTIWKQITVKNGESVEAMLTK